MLAVYGAGGFALQILDSLEALSDGGTAVCFVDEGVGASFHDFPVIERSAVPVHAAAIIAVADPASRRRIANEISNFAKLTARTAIVHHSSTIGDGTILCHHVLVEPEVSIGRHFHGNIYSYVAHQSRIGDFVTFAPRVNCNGRVSIGDGTYVGTGAFLKQGISIGEGAVVGMGSVVIHDVPPGVIVAGNPARIIR